MALPIGIDVMMQLIVYMHFRQENTNVDKGGKVFKGDYGLRGVITVRLRLTLGLGL